MASAALKGGATLTYTPSGGAETIHKLAIPFLRNPAYGFEFTRRRRVWEAWSADYTTREVFTLGAATAVEEIAVLIRMDNEPDKLKAMLRSGLEENVVITYRPTGLVAPATAYPCKLLSVEGGPDAITLRPDGDRFAMKEWQVAIVLRRVDGGTLEGLLLA